MLDLWWRIEVETQNVERRKLAFRDRMLARYSLDQAQRLKLVEMPVYRRAAHVAVKGQRCLLRIHLLRVLVVPIRKLQQDDPRARLEMALLQRPVYRAMAHEVPRVVALECSKVDISGAPISLGAALVPLLAA